MSVPGWRCGTQRRSSIRLLHMSTGTASCDMPRIRSPGMTMLSGAGARQAGNVASRCNQFTVNAPVNVAPGRHPAGDRGVEHAGEFAVTVDPECRWR